MATLKDVAEKAGVSVSTVSYVLSNKKRVKAETYQRIKNAVEETGYVMNMLAKDVSTGRSHMIGMILPNADEATWSDLFFGVEEYVEKNGYNVVCSICRNETRREEKAATYFLEQKAEGIVFVGISNPDRIHELIGELPVVYIERTLSNKYSYVDVDYEKVAEMTIQHLKKCEKSNIGLITGPLRYQSSLNYVSGASQELQKHGITYDSGLVCECDYSIEDGYSAMIKLLDSGKSIDAVAAFNDRMAAGVLQALHARNIRIPEQIAVIGNNDYSFCKALYPPLTSVKKDSKEMGSIAAKILLGKIDDPDMPPQQYKIEPKQLTVRGSTQKEAGNE